MQCDVSCKVKMIFGLQVIQYYVVTPIDRSIECGKPVFSLLSVLDSVFFCSITYGWQRNNVVLLEYLVVCSLHFKNVELTSTFHISMFHSIYRHCARIVSSFDTINGWTNKNIAILVFCLFHNISYLFMYVISIQWNEMRKNCLDSKVSTLRLYTDCFMWLSINGGRNKDNICTFHKFDEFSSQNGSIHQLNWMFI